MKKIASILGSGFGLYGYLPALIDIGVKKIILPSRYRAKFSLRSELSIFLNNIEWVQDEDEAIRSADTVVIALKPDLQVHWASKCLKLKNIKRLILEKPMANTPDISQSFLEEIISARKILRIGYVFRYTFWGKALIQTINKREDLRGLGKIRITWFFLANHFKNNTKIWKRYNSEGGGAIRFYGIHLIALLAELGYTKVLSSKGFGIEYEEVSQWKATFSGQSLPECEVLINTIAKVNRFSIERLVGSRTILTVSQSDPFDGLNDSMSCTGIDVRVEPLSQLCHTLWGDSESYVEKYKATINLWRMVEICFKFEKLSI